MTKKKKNLEHSNKMAIALLLLAIAILTGALLAGTLLAQPTVYHHLP